MLLLPEFAVCHYAIAITIAINYELECTGTFEEGGNNIDGNN